MTEARRLKVVHVITTLTTGGAERQVELIAANSRHDVRVVALFDGGVVAEALTARGIPVEVLGMAGWRRLASIPRLAVLLRRHRPDVVHVHLLSGQLWGIPAARLAGVRVVVSTEHSIMESTIENRPKTETLRRLYLALNRLTTQTIAVSPATVRRLRDWGVRGTAQMPVINPPIDFDSLSTPGAARDRVRAEFGIGAEDVVVGAVGRLEPVKRFGPLIRALAGRLGPGTQLVLVGDGPQRQELEELAEELGVRDAVHFTGPRADVPQLLGAMDVFVSPSRDETFGMAVVEAAGAGLPVAYAQCPAFDGLQLPAARFRDISRDATDEQELTALASAVDALLPAGRDPDAVPAELVARYGAQAAAARVDDVYSALIAGARRPRRR